MTSDQEQFVPVTSAKEIQQLALGLAENAVVLAGMTEDQHQFQFNVREIKGSEVHLEALPPLSRPLKNGEAIQLLCGLGSGLFWIKAILHEGHINQFYFVLSGDIYRMQRRENMRSSVPYHTKITYKVTSVARIVQKTDLVLKVLDLSVGGFRADWPAGGQLPKAGDHLSGFLSFPNGRPLELFGVIKSAQQGSAGHTQVGVEFQPLKLREEQALLFVCMQVLSRPR